MEQSATSLTPEQVEQYHRAGWLAPIDVMSADEALELAATLAQAEHDHADQLHAEHRNNAHLAFPFLSELVVDPRIVDQVEPLVGPDISLWSTVLFIKEPDSAAYVSWHQDGFYMGLEPSNFVTAWLALTASTVETGCVSVVPRSHRRRAEHTDTFGEDNILTRGQQVADVDEGSVVHLELAPGQMSLHHPWLIHGSQPNRSASRRIGLAMQSYMGADVRPVRGDHHVLPVRGAAPHESFVAVAAPTVACGPSENQVRALANQAMASVLYDGADKTRAL